MAEKGITRKPRICYDNSSRDIVKFQLGNVIFYIWYVLCCMLLYYETLPIPTRKIPLDRGENIDNLIITASDLLPLPEFR